MQGRRIPDEEDADFPLGEPGAYHLKRGLAGVNLLARLPNGAFVRISVKATGPDADGAWGYEEHEDGTITINPSIWYRPGEGDTEWHGFLQRGIWREA